MKKTFQRVNFVRTGFILCCLVSTYFWSCTLTDSGENKLALALPDSLQEYDEILISVRSEEMGWTTIFEGNYDDLSQVSGMGLPEGIDDDFIVEVLGFSRGTRVYHSELVFENGAQAKLVRIHRNDQTNRPPRIQNQEDLRTTVGKKLSFFLEANDPDGSP